MPRRARNEDQAVRRVLAVAREQHAMVTTAQLRACGFSRGQIEHRIASGWLTPRHRGVFLVGPLMPALGPEAAALLACPGGVLADFSAGALWGFTQRPEAVHVLVPTKRRRRPGLVPRLGAVDRSETRTRRNLLVTSPLRTLRDLQGRASEDVFAKAVWEASYLRLVTDQQATQLLGRPPVKARHEGERVLVDLILQAGLPEPMTNRRIGPWEVDLYWPERNLVVELDGRDGHGHGLGTERDVRKDAELRRRGIDVVRVTGAELSARRLAVLARIAARLATGA